MTAFTRTWDIADPADTDDAKDGAMEIRHLKEDILERLEVNHSFAGDANDGYHTVVALMEQSGDPGATANQGKLYTKDVGSQTELFYQDAAGNVVRLTQYGSIQLPSGVIMPFAGASGVVPVGWLLCYGQAVSRTTYSVLFGVIGTTYGVGDGSTTFNLPDLRGRVVAGLDNMGGSAASRLTNTASGANFNAVSLGAAGGSESNILTTTEMPTHSHTVTDPGHSHTQALGTAPGYGQPAGALGINSTATSTDTTGITLGNAGNGAAHANVQPTMVMNYIIKV